MQNSKKNLVKIQKFSYFKRETDDKNENAAKISLLLCDIAYV
jgi:hypothetical protein